MQRTASLTLSLSLLFPSSTLALPACAVFSHQAQGIDGSSITLKVSPGQGLNANFIPTGETIKKAWIDDPSRIALSFDGNLCQWSSNQQQECTNVGATVIHLRQIKPINFPDLPRSHSGSTLLTAITEGAQGLKLYQFKVVPVSGEPTCTSLTIRPDSEKPTQVFLPIPFRNTSPSPVPNRVPITTSGDKQQSPAATNPAPTELQPSRNSSSLAQTALLPKKYTEQPPDSVAKTSSGESTQAASYSQQAFNDANAVVLGLLVARQKGDISPNTLEWVKAQSAVFWLRRGKTREEAARRSEVSISTLNQLLSWGQERPRPNLE